MNDPRRLPNRQWPLPLEFEETAALSENVKAEAIRTLADLLLKAVSRMAGRRAERGRNDELKDQA